MFMELCCSVTNVFFVLVYMEVVPEPNIVGECIKVFLDDPQWVKHTVPTWPVRQKISHFVRCQNM